MGRPHPHLGRSGNGIARIRKAQGKPIQPYFHFTNGAYSAGRWETYHAKVMELYKELFAGAGVSFGSISPRADCAMTYSARRRNLVPDPKTLRSGVVVERGSPRRACWWCLSLKKA